MKLNVSRDGVGATISPDDVHVQEAGGRNKSRTADHNVKQGMKYMKPKVVRVGRGNVHSC